MADTQILKGGTCLGGMYELRGTLGTGGMGTVYKAVHLVSARTVAIKVLKPRLANDRQLRQRFHDEGQIQAQFRHPNLVSVYDVIEEMPTGDTPGKLLLGLVMEYVPGHNLADHIYATEAHIPQEQAVGLGLDLLAGLAHAHKRHIIHRDIKPDNVFLAQRKDRLVPKLGDFGIAKDIAARAGLTATGDMIGTPCYTAPEQAIDGRDADARSDIYAVGVTLYELFTGSLPFYSEHRAEIVRAHIEEPPPPMTWRRDDIDLRIEAVIMRALEKDPAARFQSAEQMASALKSTRHQPEVFRAEMRAPQDGSGLAHQRARTQAQRSARNQRVHAPAKDTLALHLHGDVDADEDSQLGGEPQADRPPPSPRGSPFSVRVPGDEPGVDAPAMLVQRNAVPASPNFTPPEGAPSFSDVADVSELGRKPARSGSYATTQAQKRAEPVPPSERKASRSGPRINAGRWATACFWIAIALFVFQAIPLVHCWIEVIDAFESGQTSEGTYNPSSYSQISTRTADDAKWQKSVGKALGFAWSACNAESGFGSGRPPALNGILCLAVVGWFVLRRLARRQREA